MSRPGAPASRTGWPCGAAVSPRHRLRMVAIEVRMTSIRLVFQPITRTELSPEP